MAHLFVSYKRENEEIVSAVASRLKESGHEIWQDTSGKSAGIPFSTKWFEVIQDAIFTAEGAIIFKTSEWEKSEPCKKEYAMIQARKLKHIIIETEHIDVEAIDGIVEQIESWYRNEIKTYDKDITSLLTQVYHFMQNPKAHIVYPEREVLRKYKGLAWENGFFSTIPASYDELKKHEASPEAEFFSLGTGVRLFLRKASRRQFRKRFILVGLTLSAIAAIITAVVGAMTLITIISMNAELSQQRAVIRQIRDVAEHSPVEAIRFLRNEALFEGKDLFVSRSMFFLDLLNREYPAEIHPEGSEAALRYAELPPLIQSARYRVQLSGNSGIVTIASNNEDLSWQFILDERPYGYAWNEDGSLLAVWANNRVYVYDATLRGQPYALWGNSGTIVDVRWKNNRIAAVTESGNVVIWENPILPVTQQDNIWSGRIILNGYKPVALYVNNNELVKHSSEGMSRTYLDIGFDIDKFFIAVSEDGNLAAVSYTGNYGTDYIMTIDLEEMRILRHYPTNASIRDLVFDGNQRIIAACFFMEGVLALNLESGELRFSAPSESQYFAIAPYRDGWLVSSVDGGLHRYDANLNLMAISYPRFFSAPRMIAISEEFGYAFFALHGGNNLFNIGKLNLETGARSIFPLPNDDTTASVTAVTVSDGGNFVALGHPNGRITVWDVFGLNLLQILDTVREPVYELRFSADNQRLYSLGESGTLYTQELTTLMPVRTEADALNFINTLTSKADALLHRLYEMGLQ